MLVFGKCTESDTAAANTRRAHCDWPSWALAVELAKTSLHAERISNQMRFSKKKKKKEEVFRFDCCSSGYNDQLFSLVEQAQKRQPFHNLFVRPKTHAKSASNYRTEAKMRIIFELTNSPYKLIESYLSCSQGIAQHISSFGVRSRLIASFGLLNLPRILLLRLQKRSLDENHHSNLFLKIAIRSDLSNKSAETGRL